MNIFDLVEEINIACESKKIVCKSVQDRLIELGLHYATLGTSSKYKLGNRCNLVYIDNEQYYNSPGFYIIVGTAAMGRRYNIYCGYIRKLNDDEVVALKLFNDQTFINEENRKKD